MEKILKEGLDYRDLVNQILPEVSVDEYAAKMGGDDEIVTLSFVVKSRAVAQDFVEWLERGYSWVLDAQPSEGEVKPNRWLVFVELDRRTSVPSRILEILKDLKTLTDLEVEDWRVIIDDEQVSADESILKARIILSPHAYREKHGTEDKENEEDLNEMRNLSGLEPKKKFQEQDNLLKDFISKAGL